ncbi:Periplasmic serine endoprotease DegP [Nocardioides aquaticus]|uniref:Periplasmic serine endoprotease DegP n=2 Tax=Nocardioides aquaticus TaxID=160826 RepID=A0ABX8ELH9_9ACTN|nr:trypsin-like peptidase domain-containing protein [Nocardioides aquaticus]QVT81236.1 Periplasmic serine endoprotease DegP [Nocardioides aquaticus]
MTDQPRVPEPAPESWVPPAAQPPPPYAAPAAPVSPAAPVAPQPAWGPVPLAPAAGPAPGRPTGRVSGWVWPAVVVLALVVGLLGGLAGGVVWQEWDDDRTTASGGDPEGLAGVDTTSLPPLAADDRSVAAVAQEMLPRTVQIAAALGGQAGGATGSGFLLDRQGHVVTNNHVVADADANGGLIEVVDEEGNRFDARVVGRSPVYDLAVLDVPGIEGRAPAALGRSRALRVGETVVAIGSPLGLSSTVTSGIVSALSRPVTTSQGEDDSSFIDAVQTDAAINPGNSGGPLVNLSGQVVGVNSAIATAGSGLGGGSGNIGVGFAIPVEQVRVTADQILRDGEAQYPVIGAEVQTGEDTTGGAEVTRVLPDSPAASAGLRDGDLVVGLDGDLVTDGVALIVALRTRQPGDTVALTVRRDGEEQQVEIVLAGETG